MNPGILPLGAEVTRGHIPGLLAVAPKAWCATSLRQWAWATAIGVFLFLAHVVGVLPAALYAPNPVGSPQHGWGIDKYAGLMVVYLAAAYCLLLTMSIAEYATFPRLPPRGRYVAAGVVACCAAILVEVALYRVLPSRGMQPSGMPVDLDALQLLYSIVWLTANFVLMGGLALGVYVYFRSARLARDTFNAAEFERVAASREVLASRLAAMQARVEPAFLLSTLAQVEALYERDAAAGDRMLDGLIAYLHAALPQLRSQRSTLKAEAQLAESYLAIVKIRMGSRLEYQIDVGPDVEDCDFPPMVVLPLIDEALRGGLEPLPHGGKIAIAAGVSGDRVRVRIADDALPRASRPHESTTVTTLRERLDGLYGAAARLELATTPAQGVVATIEVPLESMRDHC